MTLLLTGAVTTHTAALLGATISIAAMLAIVAALAVFLVL